MILILLPAAVDFFHLALPRPGNPDSQTTQIIALPALFLSLFWGIIGPLRRTIPRSYRHHGDFHSSTP